MAALGDTGHNQQTIEYIRQERSRFSDRLSGLKQLRVYPSAVNFILAEITGGMTARELQGRLMQQRLLIRDCANFVGLTPHFFRVAVRTREENDRLVGALKGILE